MPATSGPCSASKTLAVLDDVVRSAAHEPDAVRVRSNSERLRREGCRAVIEHLARTFGLAKNVDVAAATDLLLLYGGSAVYRTLVVDYGWTTEQFKNWLTEALLSQILA